MSIRPASIMPNCFEVERDYSIRWLHMFLPAKPVIPTARICHTRTGLEGSAGQDDELSPLFIPHILPNSRSSCNKKKSPRTRRGLFSFLKNEIPAIPTFALVGTIIGSESLTAVFGMGTGVAFPIWSPGSNAMGRSNPTASGCIGRWL